MKILVGSKPHALLLWSLLLSQVLVLQPALAIFEKENWPWKIGVKAWQEAEMQEAIGESWYLNVGPTGIRAQITHEHPAYFTVRYVFKRSPAHGRLNPGDVIIGANGKVMRTPHTFGRGRNVDGWDGPLIEMAQLIEDSQASGGKLELIVWPNGKQSERKTITLQIQPRERFSKTYPFNCSRSDQLVAQLTEAIVEDYKRNNNNRWGRPHVTSHCILALMASGDKKYESMIRDFNGSYANYRTEAEAGGFPSWGNGYAGIIMGELYARYKDKRLLRAIASVCDYYDVAAEPSSGSFSHRPFPVIQQRIADGGGAGYGAMASPGGLSMLAMSIFRANGLNYPERSYNRLHQSYLRCARPDILQTGYGFPGSGMAVISLEDASKARSPRGCGYFAQEGMEDIKKFTVRYPAPGWPGGHADVWTGALKEAAALNKKPLWWLKDEAKTNLVYDITAPKAGRYNSPHVRYIVRQKIEPEPTRPYRTSRGHARAATGMGALAHLIGNSDRPSWGYLGDHAANSCALDPRNWLSGHASSSMHQLWVALAAARADEKHFREFMDQVKWWFIMQEDFRGTYLILPDRDRDTNSDPYYGGHMLPTANAAIIFSLPRRQLLITGAEIGTPRPQYRAQTAQTGSFSGTTSRSTTSIPRSDAPLRIARRLQPGRARALDQALLNAIKALHVQGKTESKTIELTRFSSPLTLVDIKDSGDLVFDANGVQRSIAFSVLSSWDCARIAMFVAEIAPESQDAQAMAGIYLETANRVLEAEAYYSKAGDDARKKFENLFQ